MILTWTLLAAAWGVLAREYNTGRRNVSALEAGTMWAALAVATLAAVGRLLA